MLSFNHYAYGAVLDWVYRNIAGIAPDPAAPGYRSVVLAPCPVAGVDHVAASIRTGFGALSVDWTTDDTGQFSAQFRTTARYELGRRACQLLLAEADAWAARGTGGSDHIHGQVEFTPELVVRASSGSPRSARVAGAITT